MAKDCGAAIAAALEKARSLAIVLKSRTGPPQPGDLFMLPDAGR